MAANRSRLATTAFHVHLALSMDQAIGTIPGRAILRTFANEPEQSLTVAVGGLSNQFLFGEYVHPPTGDDDEWKRISFMRDGLFHFDHGGLR